MRKLSSRWPALSASTDKVLAWLAQASARGARAGMEAGMDEAAAISAKHGTMHAGRACNK